MTLMHPNTEKSHNTSHQKGAAVFIAVLFFVMISLVLTGGLASPLIREFKSARDNITATQSYYVAEAGNEDAYYRVKNSMSIGPLEQLVINGATSTISVIDTGSGKMINTSSTFGDRVRKVATNISQSGYQVDLDYGVFSGEAGANMSNNVSVQGSGGSPVDVYSNGPIIGGNNMVIAGNAISASDVVEDTTAASTVCNSDETLGKTSPNIDYAQSFVPAESKPLLKVSIYLKKVGNPGNKTIRITADNGGKPSTTSLASQTLDKNFVSTSYGWVNIVFNSPASLTAGQTYWLVFDGGTSNRKYWMWCKDSSGGYGNGSASYSSSFSGGTWTGITGDLAFKTYLGTNIGLISGVEVMGDAKANTITGSHIHGDAYYQTISGTTVNGTQYPDSIDPPPLEMPIPDSEVDGWKADATAGGVISGSCPGATGCSLTMGPTKIVGNLSVSNNQTFVVTGTLYVTGNISLSNNVLMKCDSSYGANGCIVIADGSITLGNNGTGEGSGTAGSFLMFVSMKTGGSGVTGIDVSNNANAVVLYAPYSKVSISNNANVAVAMGYYVDLSNNTSITFQPGLLGLNFAAESGGGGGTGGWVVNSWKEVQ